MTRSPVLSALLGGLVDYAGLFPPASLGLPEAVARYATYHAGDHRQLLGRFVLPAARLDEFAVAVSHASVNGQTTAARRAWRLSVLATPADADRLHAFNAWEEGRATIDAVEAKAETLAGIDAIAEAFGGRYPVYVEVPVRADPAPLLTGLRARGLRAKVRTGGVTVEAFPAPDELLRFLATCASLDLPFKATAGLHHPLRGEYPLTYEPGSPHGTMYGFLNVFLASLLLRKGVPAAEVAPLLVERDPSAIRVTDDGIRWRTRRLTLSDVAEARAGFAGSFGSCSFEEPVQDLSSLRLL